MSKKTMRILSVLAGVLLVAAGIYCLCNQDVAVLSAGILLGLFMLCAGVLEIIIFSVGGGLIFGSGWLLLDGVLTVLLSMLLLFNQWFTMVSLPILFTLWLLFSGVLRFVSAFDLRVLGVRSWGLVLALGILLLVLGIVGLLDPVVSTVAFAITVGLVFILEGISIVACTLIAAKADL